MITVTSNANTEHPPREDEQTLPILTVRKPADQARAEQERAWKLEAERRAAYVADFNPCGLY